MASSPPKTPKAIPALAPALVEPLSSGTALELELGRLEAPDMSATPSIVVEADAAPVALARMDSIDWLSTGSRITEGTLVGSSLLVI
jgi:hypothetical protein